MALDSRSCAELLDVPDEEVREQFLDELGHITPKVGLDVAVGPLVGVFTRMPSARNGPHTMIAVVHLYRVVGGELTLSHEGLDLRYWPIEEVEDWHTTHETYARAARKRWASGSPLGAVSG